MTAHESTNAHGDAHGAALLRSRKRAALAAWNEARLSWLASSDYSITEWMRLAALLWPGVRVHSPGPTSEGK